MDVDREARAMLADCIAAGQSARRVDRLDDADGLRAALRALAREQRIRVRTALMDDFVVIARTDAQLWHDDTATMKRKLTPPT